MTSSVSPPATIPNPLTTGDYTMDGGAYTGDVGNIVKVDRPILRMENSAYANVTMARNAADPSENRPHYALFNAMAGISKLDLTTGITRNSPYGLGDAWVVLDGSSFLSGTADLGPGANVLFTGDGTLAGYTINANSGGTVTIDSSLTGNSGSNGTQPVGSKINLVGSPDVGSPAVAINGYADSNTLVTMGSGNVEIAHPEQFHGTVDWSPSGPSIDNLQLNGVKADSYTLDPNGVDLWQGHSYFHINLTGSPSFVSQDATGTALSTYPQTTSATQLGVHQASADQVRAVISDTDTNWTDLDPGSPYNGPVPGLEWQVIDISPDNLNVKSLASNGFIHTGGGNDAVDLSNVHGINVVDAAGGSNFVAGTTDGKDTFFADARGATVPLWDTISNFHSGDAGTLWGVTPQDFDFAWLNNDGAKDPKLGDFRGLTLHATPKSGAGPEVSMTFTGHSISELASGSMQVSQGVVDGNSYTYVTQV